MKYFKKLIPCVMSLLLCISSVHCVNNLCIFGEEENCFFPCHCSSGTCDRFSGTCDAGCEKGKPKFASFSGVDWQGPGCQIGNLAYQKPTLSNTVITKNSKHYNRPHLWYDTNKTTDGLLKLRVFDGSCTVVYTANKTMLPWMMVDLQKPYIITKIVLVNTDNSVDASYLETFNIKIGNTTKFEDQTLCARWNRKIGAGQKTTISCASQIYGRYVSIKKYSERNKVGRLPLCEIAVMGHEYLEVDWNKCVKPSPFGRLTNKIWCENCEGMIPPDCKKPCPENSYGAYCEGVCGHCNEGKTCDKVEGTCEICELGWKPPKCNVPCPNNTYGYDCVHDCGKCENNVQCDLNTGECVGRCQLWYTNEDRKCNTFIPVVNAQSKPTVMFTKETWAMLSIRLDYPYTLENYYQFKLFYLHENDPLARYQDYKNCSVHYNNETHEVQIHIDGLEPETQYWFMLQVFRIHRNQSEGGLRSAPIKLMTHGDKTDDIQADQSQIRVTTTVSPAGLVSRNKTSTKPQGNNTKVSHSMQKPQILPHHVSTLTVALNLVIFTILIAVGVAVGVYFFRKHRAKHESRLSQSPHDTQNMCYTSQVNIIDQIEEQNYEDC